MTQSFTINAILACAGALALATLQSAQASIIFDDFNVNEGHFTSNPYGGSGSSVNLTTDSTADRVTTNSPVEGVGHQALVLKAATVGTAIRLRHLSGGGTPANNIAFTTSAANPGSAATEASM